MHRGLKAYLLLGIGTSFEKRCVCSLFYHGLLLEQHGEFAGSKERQ